MTKRIELPFDEPEASRGPDRHVWTVAALTAGVRVLLESKYAEIWIEGEISNARLWKSGHLYFTLKDASAQLNAVMFRSALRYLRFQPDNGQHVVARGRISVYEPKGEYQIVCEHLEPHGLGALQLAFNQLRQRLDREGLFDDAHKRPLPSMPRKIGVVTSLDGAAVRDIINVLYRRYPNVHLVISPARVQGENAASEIARGLKDLGRFSGVDVIIVGRGGGTIEDLWAFNDEQVARAIAAAPVPVVSAVGHETDYTISDFVAALRAPTPSAGAELVVASKDEIETHVRHVEERLTVALRDVLLRRRAVVHRLQARPGLAGWPAHIAMRGRQVDELAHRLTAVFQARVGSQERRVHELRLRLDALGLATRIGVIRWRAQTARAAVVTAIRETHRAQLARLRIAVGRLETLSPLAVLSRGYAVCWSADRSSIIRDATTVLPGQGVHITLQHGTLDCEVTKAE